MTKINKICITLAGTAVLVLFASCASSTPTQLYSWGSYESASFHVLKKADSASQKELLAAYDYIMNGQKNTIRQTVPPGICADYGYMLINNGKKEEGIKLLQKEIELYPESKTFIDKILGMVKNEK